MTSHFEKPKDWNVAPQSSWVSGTPVGQSEIKMPNLGDPGSHENASQPVSFGDDNPQAEGMARIGPGGKMIAPGQPCPPGYKSESGACIPNPESTASLEARQKSMRGEKEEKPKADKPTKPSNFDRDIPKAPETDPQVRRIAKGGWKARGED
ncbi:MAG: hypothetical protein EB075_12115 [Bacteroidetes bacterium]|nr:hypothetical protein [Bacteroidota bacterium]